MSAEIWGQYFVWLKRTLVLSIYPTLPELKLAQEPYEVIIVINLIKMQSGSVWCLGHESHYSLVMHAVAKLALYFNPLHITV